MQEVMTKEQIYVYLNQIIDETHTLFTTLSDETLLEETSEYGIFSRDFLHDNGKKFRMKWKVLYGTPDTVQTIFYPAEVI